MPTWQATRPRPNYRRHPLDQYEDALRGDYEPEPRPTRRDMWIAIVMIVLSIAVSLYSLWGIAEWMVGR